MTPRTSLIFTGGFSSPPVENKEITKAALTKLVIKSPSNGAWAIHQSMSFRVQA